MEQWYRFPGTRIEPFRLRVLVAVTSLTRQGEILQRVAAAPYDWIDMLDGKRHTENRTGARQYSHKPLARARTTFLCLTPTRESVIQPVEV